MLPKKGRRVFTCLYGPIVVPGWTGTTMAKRRRSRGIRGAGTITQLPSGRWRLRVTLGERQVTYGTYLTEDEAANAQARWRLTHLLPADDPEQAVELPPSVAVGGVRCDEWFLRWQEAKKARRSVCGSTRSVGALSRQRHETEPIGRSGGRRFSDRGCRTRSPSATSWPSLTAWRRRGWLR